MIPLSRLRLKRATGWFAAGQEMAAALELLSDAAFKLYVFLCLNVDRHSGRMVWEALDLANLLQRDRQSVAESLDELCRQEVCVRHPDAHGRLAAERLSVEICDRYWPYEKARVEDSGVDQNGYVQRVRQMLSGTACMRVNFSAADERLAAIFYRRGITLVHLQRAIWLGCARKYVALLNGRDKAPMFINSLNYFSGLVEEANETSVGEDYWRHLQSKVAQLERMWMEVRDEMKETK